MISQHSFIRVHRKYDCLLLKRLSTAIVNFNISWHILFHRTQGLSFASFSARVGATPAPFLTESLKLINPSLPFILMGILSILSGLTSLFLPETVGKPTLESIDANFNGNSYILLNESYFNLLCLPIRK